MSTTRITGFVLLAIGVVLLIFGYNASQSTGEQLVEGFTGRYSDETMWYIILGIAGVVAGGGLALFGRKRG